jgi:hypothetical protein
MPDFYKTIKVTQPNLGGPLNESLVGVVQFSTGTAADAGKVVALDPTGKIDASMIPGGSSTVSINGSPVTNPNFQDGDILFHVSGSNITETVHALATTGASVTTSTSAPPSHQGQLLISQPGNTSAAWADPFVQGPWINGTAVVSPGAMGDGTSNIQPVFVAGYDGTNMRGFLTDSSGRLVVNINGTVTIIGNKSVNTAAPGATNVGVLSGQANASPQTWTEGFQVPLSTDLSGNLRVTTVGGGSSVQYAEGTVIPTATGTVALGKDATNTVHALKLDGSGNLDVNTQSSVFAAVDGVANPSNTVWIAATDGTNIHGLQVESSTNKNLKVAIYNGSSEVGVTGASLNVNVTNTTVATQDAADVTAGTTSAPTKILIVGGKTADGSPAYDPIPLIAGGTAVSVSSVHDFAQGSTTSGQVGPLVQGAVLTSDPTYTTGQTDPLSLTTTGHLRTQDTAAGTTGISVPLKSLYVGALGADGFLHGLSSSTNDGKLDVNASFSGSVSTDFIVDRIQSGTITSTETVQVNTKGAASVVFNITGTWTGTIVFEALMPDTTNWVSVFVYAKFPSGAAGQSTTANGKWALPVGGINQFRVRGNTVSSGTATANLEAGAGGLIYEVAQQTASNLNATVTGTVTANQGGAPWSMVGTLTNNNAAPTNGNLGVLPALVVSGAQSWTAGRQALLTVSTGGYLLTEDLSDGNANGSTTAPTTALLAGAKGADGFLHPLSTSTNNGFLDVNASISGSFTPALTQDNFTSPAGTITANGQSVTLPGNGSQGTGTTFFRISGTWNGTLTFQVSIDGSNFVAAKCLQRFPTGSLASSLTQNSGAVTYWSIATGGIRNFQVTSTAWTSGTATIWIEAGAGAQDIQTLSIPFDPASSNFATIKSASTTPLATDTSLVVSLSPNSAITTTIVPTTAAEALVVALSPNSAQFATSTTANTLPGTNPQTIGASSSAVVNANAARKEVTIVNTGTTFIYLGLGQTPTTTAYHIALAKCTAANDGTGGTWTSDMWKGAVNAISSAPGGTVVLLELT